MFMLKSTHQRILRERDSRIEYLTREVRGLTLECNLLRKKVTDLLPKKDPVVIEHKKDKKTATVTSIKKSYPPPLVHTPHATPQQARETDYNDISTGFLLGVAAGALVSSEPSSCPAPEAPSYDSGGGGDFSGGGGGSDY